LVFKFNTHTINVTKAYPIAKKKEKRDHANAREERREQAQVLPGEEGENVGAEE
jgi:hypothetical protein